MADATPAELRNMTPADLRQEIREHRLSVAKLRTQLRLGKEKNVQKYHAARKHLARMLTVLSSTPTK